MTGAADPAQELLRLRLALARAEERAEHLEAALHSSRRIGMALGIVMERRKVTGEQAFDELVGISSRRNVKLRIVAEEILSTGEDPARPRGEVGREAAPPAVISTDGA